MAFLSQLNLEKKGFASLGKNVSISEKASLHNCSKISIGNNVRIDDFCVLSAGDNGIYIGNYIHIAVFTSLIGKGKITLSDYCNLSSRVSIYSSSDDFSGSTMTNPLIPEEYKKVFHGDVFLGRHVIVGSGSLILPGVVLEEGVAVGAHSIIKENCRYFGVYAGNPAKRINERKQDLLVLEKMFVSSFKKEVN